MEGKGNNRKQGYFSTFYLLSDLSIPAILLQVRRGMKGSEFFKHIAAQPPFSKMHPAVAAFFMDYLSNEKVIRFDGRYVMNTHFPPYPGRAFDNLAEQFGLIGEAGGRQLYSVTLGVTNRCMYRCGHCYNAGRSQNDLPLTGMKDIVADLQELNAVRVTLSGGEPLLRNDLEDIAGSFDERTFLNLNTTGAGLSAVRARALKDSGVFAAGISVDSDDPGEHDRMRGMKGAFTTALEALGKAADAGLYPYIVTVASHDFLGPENFWSFMRFAAGTGALEVHLLEPCATGRLAGNSDVLLTPEERDLIIVYQKEIASDEELPILSTFTYLESPEAFGCGAGITHLYIDGSGEVSPCNLVPLSFGNVMTEPLGVILDRMGRYFCTPRTGCVGQTLAGHIPGGEIPVPPVVSCDICEKHLPRAHEVPRFFRIKSGARGKVGGRELKDAYDHVHGDYDEFWVSEAGKPVADLVERLSIVGGESVFEAGCGTGFATVKIAAHLDNPAHLTAVDLSRGMLGEAKKRAASAGIDTIRFIEGDALEILGAGGPYDIVFTSWVLGYIPLEPFFAAARNGLARNGRLAFIVHRDNSPHEPLEIFTELVARDPSVLLKQVAFDFPRDTRHLESTLASAGLKVEFIHEGDVVFLYDTAIQVLEHLLKSGAGTAFYESVDPTRRPDLERLFIEILTERHHEGKSIEVRHEYFSCIAVRP